MLASAQRPGLQRSVLYQWIGVSLLVLLAALLAIRGDWMWRVDQTLYDAALKLWERELTSEVVIVAIDDASLERLGKWPWPRARHAEMVDRLGKAGARAIGFDIIFSEPDKPADDAALARAIKANGRVALPVHMRATSGGVEVSRPVAVLAGHARLAHAHIELDADGMARSVFLREGRGRPEFPHLSAAVVAIAHGDATPLPGLRHPGSIYNSEAWVRDYWLHIPFAGPPGAVKQVSYADVMDGRVADGVFRDRIVLVGTTAPGMLDSYPTPVSGGARSMPGVEITAHAVDAILHGYDVQPVSRGTRLGFSALLLLVPLLGLLWLQPRRAFALSFLASLLTLLVAIFMARWPGLWFPPAVPALAALLAYPLWSWRRLEASQRFLESELAVMGKEPDLLTPPQAARTARITDPIERRIAEVRTASARLRAARRFVGEVVEHLPQATLVIDLNGSVVLGNAQAAQLFGMTAVDELRGRDVAGLLARLQADEGSAADAFKAGRDVFEAGTAAFGNTPSGGVEKSYLVRVAELADDGASLGRIISFNDITALKSAQRKREDYMAFLSHDMRSPQVSILALLELVSLAPERAPANLNERIEKLARRTLELADDFVQLARAEAQDTDAFAPLDLAEVLREAVADMTTLASAKDIAIDVESVLLVEPGTDAGLEAGTNSPTGASPGPGPNAAPIAGERQLLTRAIINLLSNAVKYSERATRIGCELRIGATFHELLIRDQGRGISAEDLPRLFDRFSRFDSPGASRTAGAGLGLAFVKTVFDKHEAAVHVESTPGQGTLFRIRFRGV
jgi:PAS domain S-box-containing protein